MKLALFTENYMAGGRRLDVFRQSLLTILASFGERLLLLQTNDYCDRRGEFCSSKGRRHCERALERFQPDLILSINGNGLATSLKHLSDAPIRTWYIDNPYRFAIARQQPSDRERVFCSSRTSVEWCTARYGKDAAVEYLPLCTDEVLFDPRVEETREPAYEVSFVGTLWNPDRLVTLCDETCRSPEMTRRVGQLMREYQQAHDSPLLAEVGQRWGCLGEDELRTLLDDFLSTRKRLDVLQALADLNLRVIGPGWAGQMLLRSEQLLARYDAASVKSSAELAAVYRDSKVAISIAHHQAQSGFPIRIYDILAIGTPLVTDRHPELAELFVEGEMYLGADTPAEASDAVRELLRDPAKRRRLSGAGREAVLGGHTFAHRLARLLGTGTRSHAASTLTLVSERLDPSALVDDPRTAGLKVDRQAIGKFAHEPAPASAMEGTVWQKARQAMTLSMALARVWGQVGILAGRSLLTRTADQSQSRARRQRVLELGARCVYSQLEAGQRAREILIED